MCDRLLPGRSLAPLHEGREPYQALAGCRWRGEDRTSRAWFVLIVWGETCVSRSLVKVPMVGRQAACRTLPIEDMTSTETRGVPPATATRWVGQSDG